MRTIFNNIESLLYKDIGQTQQLVKNFSFSDNCRIEVGNLNDSMDHLHYRLNFDLDKKFITA
jgi:hypothetical protein